MAVKGVKKVATKTTTPVEKPVVENVSAAKEVVKPKEKKVFQQNDGIMTTSITTGTLIMIGIKTGIVYTWADYGDQTEVEYADLVAAVRSSKDQVYKPYFIIDDEDFLENYPNVSKIYENIPDSLEDVFRLSNDKFKKVISTLPEGARESLKSMAAKFIQSGELDSVAKIRAMDETFGCELSLLTE